MSVRTLSRQVVSRDPARRVNGWLGRGLRIAGVVSLWVSLLVPIQTVRADSAAPLSALAAFRQNLLIDRRKNETARAKLQDDIRRLNIVIMNLKLPERQEEAKKAQANLAAAKIELKVTEDRLRDIDTFYNSPCLALPLHLEGHVRWCTGENACQDANDRRPLMEGEMLRTGADGSLLLAVEDGSRVIIGPDSVFALKSRGPSDVVYRLDSGRLHWVHEPVPIQGLVGLVTLETPGSRLTLGPDRQEFDIRLDGMDRAHVRLQDGSLDITATPSMHGVIDRRDSRGYFDRVGGGTVQAKPEDEDWWRREVPESLRRALTASDWCRLASLDNVVAIWRGDGEPRRAAVGDELQPSESLATSGRGRAWVFVEGDGIGALQPDTVLRYRRARQGGPAWLLEKGDFHLATRKVSEETPLPGLWTADVKAAFPMSEGLFKGGLDLAVRASARGGSEWIPISGHLRLAMRGKGAPAPRRTEE